MIQKDNNSKNNPACGLLTVGVTGPTGAGKSSLQELAEEFGFVWLDCDVAAREIVMPGQPALGELAAAFGSDILLADGSLNRRLLAERAFSSPEGTCKLNQITHPRITQWLIDRRSSAFALGKSIVIDAPLLFDAGVDELCDVTIAVVAPG